VRLADLPQGLVSLLPFGLRRFRRRRERLQVRSLLALDVCGEGGDLRARLSQGPVVAFDACRQVGEGVLGQLGGRERLGAVETLLVQTLQELGFGLCRRLRRLLGGLVANRDRRLRLGRARGRLGVRLPRLVEGRPQRRDALRELGPALLERAGRPELRSDPLAKLLDTRAQPLTSFVRTASVSDSLARPSPSAFACSSMACSRSSISASRCFASSTAARRSPSASSSCRCASASGDAPSLQPCSASVSATRCSASPIRWLRTASLPRSSP
jgi:hypothetical protein